MFENHFDSIVKVLKKNETVFFNVMSQVEEFEEDYSKDLLDLDYCTFKSKYKINIEDEKEFLLSIKLTAYLLESKESLENAY